ncbi:MAG: hypothetical protein JPMHGGIA_00567 [Saprospiraceae bacterium]|jgi:hypothetical protein|nr:hypothetical protein [Saprospiraceae bacterium]
MYKAKPTMSATTGNQNILMSLLFALYLWPMWPGLEASNPNMPSGIKFHRSLPPEQTAEIGIGCADGICLLDPRAQAFDHFQLMDLLGRTLDCHALPDGDCVTIDLSQRPRGLYFLALYDQDGRLSHTRRLVWRSPKA